MRQLHIDTMDDYTKHFETPGNKNWLKGAVAVNITKRGLASFACQVCDEIRVHNLKLALKQLFPDLCGNCSIVEAIPCDPANTICNAGKCLFHNGRVFRPCPIVKCNNYRNTISDKITKGIDIGVTCKSCNTPEIVHCNPKNRVCNHGRCKFHHDPTTKKVILNKPCLKNICDTLRNAIEHSHRFSNPSWKNTDTRKWCVNAWDIAKCFMPPDGYADVDNQDDTDLNGIISVFINCEEIQPYFTADLSHAQNICVKVREVGKRLRHAPGLDVNDADLKNWFSDLKALFCDVTFNTACPNAQTAIDQLEKLENDDLKIERSDIIAAIKDSVSCLKRLKPSFDPEALDDIRHQIGILENTLEEVIAEGIHKLERATEAGVKDIVHATEEGREDIRDEINRGIVTIRGSSETSEIAVDEFTRELKKNLINYHRKYNSTLTLGPVLELHDAKLEDFYVPPKIVKRNLINYNREYISTLTHGPAFELDDAGLEDFNVPPKIVKNIQVALDNVEEGHGYTSGTITTFEQLFDSKQIVVITADAGVGKTSLCKFLVVLWCEEQAESDKVISKFKTSDIFLSDTEYLKRFTYLFYIPGQCIKSDNIEDIIYSHTKLVHTDLRIKNKSFDEMLSKENGLILLDGLDESFVSSINPIPANRKYTVVLTMRTWKLANITLPSKRSYQSVQIENMDATASTNLVCHANDCLNKYAGTLYDIEDFMSAVKSYYVDTLLLNPMFSIQLLCVYHDRRNAIMSRTKGFLTDTQGIDYGTPTNLGKTRSHIFAYIIEMLLQNVQETDKEAVKQLNQSYAMAINMRDSLPICFRENTLIYNELANFILHIGELAFNCLMNEDNDVIREHEMKNYLSSEEIYVLLKSGLLTATNTETFTTKSVMYSFLHQTYKEMLACVYLSSLSIECEKWQRFEQRIGIKLSPDMLSFLCVMNYTQGCRCFDIYQAVKRTFLRDDTMYISELTDYQTAVQMAYDECRKNGIAVPQLFLKHAIFGKYSEVKIDPALLQRSYISIESVAFIDQNECLDLSHYQNLRELYLSSIQFTDDVHLDISGLRNLFKIYIQVCRLARVTINPSCIHTFWIFMGQEFKQEVPPMNVSFDGGEHFSSSLQNLCLSNLIVSDPADLLHCQNLHVLQIHKINFPTDAHLDLSGLIYLTDIYLTNNRLAHITIDTSSLEELWISLTKELIEEIPPMKVSFDGRQEFSSNLKILSLVYVDMEVPLNLLHCKKLQKLLVHSIYFTTDAHLDLSGLTNLIDIEINNNHLVHVTINPSPLERFWTSVTPALIQEIPPMKVSFDGGEQFSSSLQKLNLSNITMDDTADLLHCQNLQELQVNNIIFPTDAHLDLSGLTNLSEVYLMSNRLARITINTSSLETLWIFLTKELIEEIPPMKLSFDGRQHLSCSLKQLSLVNVILEVPLNLLHCKHLEKLLVVNIPFPTDAHLDLSGLIYLSVVYLTNNRLARITINTSSLETLLISLTKELIEEIPPTKISFDGRQEFSCNLKHLSLVNVVMDGPLNLLHCKNLQKLLVDNIPFTTGAHLDLSGLTNLIDIEIKNSHLAHVTINPSALETFWTYVTPALIQEIPPMKVSFDGGKQFSSSLQKLNLSNLTMDDTADLLHCQNLQILHINNINFPTDAHLDLRGLIYLTDIYLTNNRLARITINTSSLETLAISLTTELTEETPPMKVSFDGRQEFSCSLKNLGLKNVVMEVPLYLLHCKNLQYLLVHNTPFTTNAHLDLSGLTHLIRLDIVNTTFDHVTLNTSSLEEFCATIRPDLIKRMSPIKVSFDGEEQFCSSLKKLCLVNVIMDAPLDLLHCNNLQELQLCNVSFTEDAHLDLSGLTNLSLISIMYDRPTRVTRKISIIETIWSYIRPESIKETPPMKVSFDGREQFSDSVQILYLANILMEVPLDHLYFQNLQELHIENIPFTTDAHLDLSGLTNLYKITIRNNRLAHVTLNPFFLKTFLTYIKPELLKEIPPMKVSFDDGEQFSSSLQNLSLVNVLMEDPFDLLNCQNLKQLVVIHSHFRKDTHLDLSGQRYLSNINIQNSRLANVTINPSMVQEFLIYFRSDLIQDTLPLNISLVGGSQFSRSLQTLILENVTLDSPLDFSHCQELQVLNLNLIEYSADSCL